MNEILFKTIKIISIITASEIVIISMIIFLAVILVGYSTRLLADIFEEGEEDDAKNS